MVSIFDFKEMFRDSFGYDAPAVYKSQNPKIEEKPERAKFSNLGAPYYDEDMFGREFFMPVRINGMLIPFAVISCSWKKTIISTPLVERGGTVKEMISIDDYPINIKGILINPGDDWPEAGVLEMFSLFKINESLTMRSALTDIFLSGNSRDINGGDKWGSSSDTDGHKVIIKEIKRPAVSGVEHAKPFEMDLESDLIYDLIKR